MTHNNPNTLEIYTEDDTSHSPEKSKNTLNKGIIIASSVVGAASLGAAGADALVLLGMLTLPLTIASPILFAALAVFAAIAVVSMVGIAYGANENFRDKVGGFMDKLQNAFNSDTPEHQPLMV